MQPRERERVHTSIPVEFTSDSLSGRGRVINLAVSGCEIESETPPPADAHVTLHLHIPRQQDPLVIALAVVRWVKGAHFGVEFVRFEGSAWDQLRRMVSLLEPTDPT